MGGKRTCVEKGKRTNNTKTSTKTSKNTFSSLTSNNKSSKPSITKKDASKPTRNTTIPKTNRTSESKSTTNGNTRAMAERNASISTAKNKHAESKHNKKRSSFLSGIKEFFPFEKTTAVGKKANLSKSNGSRKNKSPKPSIVARIMPVFTSNKKKGLSAEPRNAKQKTSAVVYDAGVKNGKGLNSRSSSKIYVDSNPMVDSTNTTKKTSHIIHERVKIPENDDTWRYEGDHYVMVQTPAGKTVAMIPVDNEGNVLRNDLVRKFADTSEITKESKKRNIVEDGKKTAKTVLKVGKKAKVEDILDWWLRPSRSDIQGIDTEGSQYFSTEGAMTKEGRILCSKTAKIGMKQNEIEMANSIIDLSFDSEEKKSLARDDGRRPCVITLRKMNDSKKKLKNVGGFNGITGEVSLDKTSGIVPATLVHEMNHRLKFMETHFEKGRRDDDILKSQYEILGNINEKCIPLEEAENTLETIGRLTPYSNADGYYTYYPYLIDDIDLESLDKMRDEDRIRIVGNANPKKGGLKGIELRNKIVQEFENSNIAGICDRWDVKSDASLHGGKEREKSISSSKR